MNRAFLIIGIPAVVVSLVFITFGWGLRASVPAGTVVALASIGFLMWRRWRSSQ